MRYEIPPRPFGPEWEPIDAEDAKRLEAEFRKDELIWESQQPDPSEYMDDDR